MWNRTTTKNERSHDECKNIFIWIGKEVGHDVRRRKNMEEKTYMVEMAHTLNMEIKHETYAF